MKIRSVGASGIAGNTNAGEWRKTESGTLARVEKVSLKSPDATSTAPSFRVRIVDGSYRDTTSFVMYEDVTAAPLGAGKEYLNRLDAARASEAEAERVRRREAERERRAHGLIVMAERLANDGKPDGAKAMYSGVRKDFPGTRSAAIAVQRLKELGGR